MANLKEIAFDSLNMPEIPDTVTLSMGNTDFELIPDYIVERNEGIAPVCFAPHKHLAYEFTLIIEGRLLIDISGEPVTLHRGEYAIIPPDTEHNLISFSEGTRLFRLRFMPMSEAFPSLSSYIKDEFSGKKADLIFSLTDSLRDTDEDLNRFNNFKLAIILGYAMEKLHVINPTAATHSGQIGLRAKIENYMYLNYNKPITLELLAENLSYSRTQMRRIIEECFGMPFTEKLREIRLSSAKKYLADSHMSIEEIAEACGYETRQGFESMFLKHIGKTPNQYRRRYGR